MNKSWLKGRSLTFLTIMFVGALIGTSVLGAVPVQAATASVGDGTSVSVAYTIYKDGSGYTCAKSSSTGAIDYRNTNSKWVIQKALDKLSGGAILIKAGSYVITQTIYTNKVSIIGEGNATVLEAGSTCYGAVIRVCDDYWTLDYRYMSARPNGVTIGNLQIDGNRASGGQHLEGVGFIDCLNSRIVKVYAHDIIGGQGLYMSNSQYCSISDCVIDNIGDNTAAHYGSGIAFGEASRTKVASAYITIDNVRITRASMSSIDLEPANHVTITNSVFRDATTWKNYRTPVITEYNIYGYAACDYITVTGCVVYGAFNEFIILSPSSHSVVKNNQVSLTTGTTTAIYSTSSHENVITGNVIKTYSSNPIVLKSCTSCTVSGNTILRW
jgi:hypothetical protein